MHLDLIVLHLDAPIKAEAGHDLFIFIFLLRPVGQRAAWMYSLVSLNINHQRLITLCNGHLPGMTRI